MNIIVLVLIIVVVIIIEILSHYYWCQLLESYSSILIHLGLNPQVDCTSFHLSIPLL